MGQSQPAAGDRRSGQMIIFVTLSLFFLFSVMGLAIDLGYSYYTKVYAQSAADAAATAAAKWATDHGFVCTTNIPCNSTYTCPNPVGTVNTAFQAGCAYAQANGFTNGGSQTVTLIANNTTPPNTTGLGTALWVKATVAQTVPHMFLFWAGFQSGSVATQAIAGISSSGGAGCVYVLDPDATKDALLITGAASLTGSSCGVYVNSTGAGAIDMQGSASITVTGGPGVQIRSPGTAIGNNPWSPISPNPTSVASVADPLSSLVAPSFDTTTCKHTNYSLASSSTDHIYPDGVYCGGITVGGSAHLTIDPGIYILKGGGYNSGNSAVVNGTGVTFFLTGTGGTGMQLTGASVNNLTAPSSGAYQGILFWQDPAFGYTAANNYGNSAVLNATGTLYFPTTALNLSGAIAASKMALAVKDLNISGSATFQQDVSGAYTGLVRSKAALIQ